ncbi:MAG: hypothetical protein V3U34_00540 [candidate division NC10 bacterium]
MVSTAQQNREAAASAAVKRVDEASWERDLSLKGWVSVRKGCVDELQELGYSYVEIGQMLGVSRQRAQQIGAER